MVSEDQGLDPRRRSCGNRRACRALHQSTQHAKGRRAGGDRICKAMDRQAALKAVRPPPCANTTEGLADQPTHTERRESTPMETNQPMPANVRQALARVVAYNWPDELRDFRGSAESDHIFRAL